MYVCDICWQHYGGQQVEDEAEEEERLKKDAESETITKSTDTDGTK